VRLAARLLGTLLMMASVLGLVALSLALLSPEEPSAAPVVVAAPRASEPVFQRAVDAPHSTDLPAAVLTSPGRVGDAPAAASPLDSSELEAPRPITHVGIPAIGLSADVVPAGLTSRDGGLTWEVPAFKVGHAEATAGAGQPGNAILLGHVTSLRSGNVFASLDQVELGQTVQVFADTREFEYTVVSTRHVSRTDTSAIAQDEQPVVSLITCTGAWLPSVWDYSERLVVRAALNHDRSEVLK
jgi:sortase A